MMLRATFVWFVSEFWFFELYHHLIVYHFLYFSIYIQSKGKHNQWCYSWEFQLNNLHKSAFVYCSFLIWIEKNESVSVPGLTLSKFFLVREICIRQWRKCRKRRWARVEHYGQFHRFEGIWSDLKASGFWCYLYNLNGGRLSGSHPCPSFTIWTYTFYNKQWLVFSGRTIYQLSMFVL